MIVDTSAIIAILQSEPDAERYARAIYEAVVSRISAATYLESGIVVDGNRNPLLSRRLDEFCRDTGLVFEPVTEAQARIARDAYRDFGKGSGHPAQLNFGDCFAYALATVTDRPLLFKGADFARTDVTPAQP